jgi:hypothetical protein
MMITDPKSDWYIPPDWRFMLSWHFIVMPTAILAALFTVALTKAAHGDTTLLWVALLMGAVGVVMLFLARLPLYRQRKFLSFGPRALPAGHRRLYWTACGFIGVSAAIMVLLLMVAGR